MQIGKTFKAKTRQDWRNWLAKNHDKEKEIWFIFYRKSSGKKSISYNDAVEEALCYGWIDSTVKGLDSEKFAQRFSPRRPGSNVSQMNKVRIRKLKAAGKMTKAGLEALAKVKQKEKAHEDISPEILRSLKSNPDAWKNFRKMPEDYRRIRLAYIESRKRHGKEMYQKSLKYFIRMTAKNKRIGFVKEMR